MTADDFHAWLEAMKQAELAPSDRQAAFMLGITPNTMLNFKKKGTDDRRTALACRALLHRLKPYPD